MANAESRDLWLARDVPSPSTHKTSAELARCPSLTNCFRSRHQLRKRLRWYVRGRNIRRCTRTGRCENKWESIEWTREWTRSRTRNISFRRRRNLGKQILSTEFTIDRSGRTLRPQSRNCRLAFEGDAKQRWLSFGTHTNTRARVRNCER